MRAFLAISLAALCGGPALGQSSFSSNNQPRVITGLADLDFWTELVTGGTCTPERLSNALSTDRARTACETNDGACYERAGTAVTIACISGDELTAGCIAEYGSPGTPAFEDCLALSLNTETRPIGGLSNANDKADEFLTASTALIREDLPNAVEVTGRTSLTFPERRRILDAIENAQAVELFDCEAGNDIADVDQCRDLSGFRYLEEVARFSSLAHGLNR